MGPNPLDELVQIRDRSLSRIAPHGGSWTPAVDLYETPTAYLLVAELPGFTSDDFAVRGTVNSIVLSGRRPPLPVSAVQYLRLERGQGDFTRTFSFPEPIDVAGIAADFQRGLLSITAPKAGTSGVRRIDIA